MKVLVLLLFLSGQCLGEKVGMFSTRPGLDLVENTYYLEKYGPPEKPNREKLDGVFDLFTKIHGSKKSRREILESFKQAGEKILANPANFAEDETEAGNLGSCVKHVIRTILHESWQIPYAQLMYDSWGHPEGGWYEGNVRWPGHYYECQNAVNGDDAMLSGKWCNTFWGFKYIPYPLGIPIDISAGICIPQNCTEKSTKILFHLANITWLPLLEVECPKPHMELTTGDIVGISISAVIVTLLLLGTVVDIYGRYYKTQDQNTNLLEKVCLCFSVIANGEKLVDMTKRPGTIPVLDGIRTISTTWVILGHSLNFMVLLLDNAVRANQWVKEGSMLAIANAIYAVDTFFFLSGLLVTYLGMKAVKRGKGWINVPLMYLQRYIRLTPAYAYAILFSVGLYRHMGSGPFWEFNANAWQQQCKDDWWTNLLYINTLYPVTMQCFGIGWYLSNDMMFFILAPIFLLILYRNRWMGLTLLGFFTICSAVTTGVLAWNKQIQTSVIGLLQSTSIWARFFMSANPEPLTYDIKFTYDVYYTPWCRWSVYLIGMMTGYLLYDRKLKIKMHPIVVGIGWILSFGWALAIIYAIYPYSKTPESMSKNLTGFYQGAARPAWAICLGWVVVACTSGYGGPITKILNHPIFTPLSRLTYSAYLCHFMILYWYLWTQETLLHYLTINMVYIYLGTMVISFGCGAILSLAIEWPTIMLLKLAFPSKKPSAVNQAPLENGQTKPIENGFTTEGTPMSEKPPLEQTMQTTNGNVYMMHQVHQNGGYSPYEKQFHQNGGYSPDEKQVHQNGGYIPNEKQIHENGGYSPDVQLNEKSEFEEKYEEISTGL